MESLHGKALLDYVEQNPGINGYIVYRNYPLTIPYDFDKPRIVNVDDINEMSLTSSNKNIGLKEIVKSHKRLAIPITITPSISLTITIVSYYRLDYLQTCLESLRQIYDSSSSFMKQILRLCIFTDPYPKIVEYAKSIKWIQTTVVVSNDFKTVEENTLPALDYVFTYMKSVFNLTLSYQATFHPRLLELFEFMYKKFSNQLDSIFTYHFFAYVEYINRFESNRKANELLLEYGSGFRSYAWAISAKAWKKYKTHWYQNGEKGFDTYSKTSKLRSLYVQHPYVYPFGSFDDGGNAYYDVIQPGYFNGNFPLTLNTFPFTIRYIPRYYLGVILPFILETIPIIILAKTISTSPSLIKSIQVVNNKEFQGSNGSNASKFIGYVDGNDIAVSIDTWKMNPYIQGIYINSYWIDLFPLSKIIDASTSWDLVLLVTKQNFKVDTSKNVILVYPIPYTEWILMTSRGYHLGVHIFMCPEDMDLIGNTLKAYRMGYQWCYFTTYPSNDFLLSSPVLSLLESVEETMRRIESQFSDTFTPTLETV